LNCEAGGERTWEIGKISKEEISAPRRNIKPRISEGFLQSIQASGDHEIFADKETRNQKELSHLRVKICLQAK